MTRDTFLSLDLDYWNKAAWEPELMDGIFAGAFPVTVVTDHHDLLSAVNATPGLRRLVNIDYHSDFMSAPEPLHIGNWVNHVAWREHGEYLWISPRLNDYHLRWGYCHVGENPFDAPARLTGWRAASKREGYGDDILAGVAAAGVCVSPNYLDEGASANAALRALTAHLKRTRLNLKESAKPENNEKLNARRRNF